MLVIGDRVVLRANAPPEAEYLLFEIADIELRASEPGRVREHGYQTTAARARARLAQVGITAELARECAVAMHPVLSAAYARGPGAKHVARFLGPLELLQSDAYDAASITYHGVFIDLPVLANELKLPVAGIALQALYLATLLETEDDETTVFLSTDAWTKHRKPGERTHRRPNITLARPLSDALEELSANRPEPKITEQLARADVIAFIRSRADAAADEEGRQVYVSLERAMTTREMPDRGPLADPELWAIEVRLDTGLFDNIFDFVEEAERTRGRTPGTTYLRARASLALSLEPPKLIAERVSALALSMTSFQELCLLAAEAWLDAGDPRRAMPYARDLVDAPNIEEGLLLRAKRILARAVGAAPDKHQTYADSIPAAPLPASQRPAAPLPAIPPAPPLPSAFDATAPAQSWPPAKRPSTTPGMGATAPVLPSNAPPKLPDAASLASRVPTLDAPIKPPGLPPPPLPIPVPVPPPRNLSKGPPPLPVSAKPPSNSPAAADDARTIARKSEVPAKAYRDSRPVTRAAAPVPPPSESPTKPGPLSSMPPALRQKPEAAQVRPSMPPPPLDISPFSALPLEGAAAPDPSASFTLDLPSPESLMPETQDARKPTTSSAPPRTPSRRPPPRRHSMGMVAVETRAPPAYDPRAEPDSTEIPAAPRVPDTSGPDPHGRPTPLRPPPSEPRRSAKPTASFPPPPPFRPRMNTPALDADLPPESSEAVRSTLEREKEIRRRSLNTLAAVTPALQGASLPPFKIESPAPLLPKAPLMPRLGGAADELAEHLALPAGLGTEARVLTLPQSVLEARVAFTQLARELGLDYRLRRGIELRADVSGIEAMQSVLLESFPDHIIRTSEDALELRRHGALLSEIIARRLDAEWIDISPEDVGHWAMIVPPDTRVWPFGRVARLVAMGHKERDLVSFFFELQGRRRSI